MPRKRNENLKSFQSLLLKLQKIGNSHGLNDSLADYAPRTLQVLLATGFKMLSRREGNDMVDSYGREYELKTIDINRCRSYAICSSITLNVISRFRKAEWLFAEFNTVLLSTVYLVHPCDLETYFLNWEEISLRKNKITVHIPVNHIRKLGTIIYQNQVAGANCIEQLPSAPKADMQTFTPSTQLNFNHLY